MRSRSGNRNSEVREGSLPFVRRRGRLIALCVAWLCLGHPFIRSGNAAPIARQNNPKVSHSHRKDHGTNLKDAAKKIREHRLAEAETLVNHAVSEDPKDARAIELLGVIRAEQKKWKEAETLFRHALQVDPKLASAHVNLALLLSKTGRDDEAFNEYAAALSADPSIAGARNGLVAVVERKALAERAKGDLEGAQAILSRASQLVPSEPRLLLDLGVVSLQMGQNEKAEREFRHADKLDPHNPLIIYGLARAELALQHMPAAEKHMRQYLKVRPKDASAHYGLGRILQMLERTKEARAEFQRSIDLDPRQTESYYELGQIELDAGQYGPATKQFQIVISRNPHHGGALTGLGVAAFHEKDYRRAAGYLKEAVKAAPNYRTAHYYYGLTLARLGQTKDSERELQIAIKLDKQQKARQLRLPDKIHPPPAGSPQSPPNR